MARIKGERIELQSDMAEKHYQNMLNLGRFDVEKGRFSLKMHLVDIRNCASCFGGEHIFRKVVENRCLTVKNGAERP